MGRFDWIPPTWPVCGLFDLVISNLNVTKTTLFLHLGNIATADLV